MKKKRRIGLLLLSSIFLGGYVLSRNNVVPQSILCEDVEALSDDETQKQRVWYVIHMECLNYWQHNAICFTNDSLPGNLPFHKHSCEECNTVK